jgi:hypothetical protein
MANKQSFTADEWNKILEGVALSGVAVTAADPSGLLGMFKESFASANALVSAKQDPGANELVKAVVADFESSDGRSKLRESLKKTLAGSNQSDVAKRCLDCLRQVSGILDSKAPNDAAAFKTWLRAISSRVAEASSEGGLAGFGGTKVSDKEKATLNDISKALGIAA